MWNKGPACISNKLPNNTDAAIRGPHLVLHTIFSFSTGGVSEEELQLSKRMMKFWANFARNG